MTKINIPQQSKVNHYDAELPAGIDLTVVGANPSYDLELYRAPDNNGEPGTFEKIFTWAAYTWNPQGQRYLDKRPLDGSYWWYKSRESKGGKSPGPFTAAIRAQASDNRNLDLRPRVSVNLADPIHRGGEYLDVSGYGAVGDVKYLNGASIESGSVLLLSSDSPFRFADISKSIAVADALDGGPLVTTIRDVINRETASLNATASTTVNDTPIRWGTDSTDIIQQVLILARKDDNGLPSKVRIPSGSWWITGSLQIQDNVELKGDGANTVLIAKGPNSDPILTNSESTNRGIVVRDIVLNADKVFHSGTISCAKFSNISDSILDNVCFDSASDDAALQITGSSNIRATKIIGRNNSLSDIHATASNNLFFDDVNTSGSLDYSIKFTGVVSSSIGKASLEKQGSGSFLQDPETSAFNTRVSQDQESSFITLEVGESGSVVPQGSLTIRDFSAFGARFNSSGMLYYRPSSRYYQYFAGFNNNDNIVFIGDGATAAATGDALRERMGWEWIVARTPGYDFIRHEKLFGRSGAGGAVDKSDNEHTSILWMGIDYDEIYDNAVDPLRDFPQVESCSFEIRSGLIRSSSNVTEITDRTLFYSVTALSGSHNFYTPVTMSALSGSLQNSFASESFLVRSIGGEHVVPNRPWIGLRHYEPQRNPDGTLLSNMVWRLNRAQFELRSTGSTYPNDFVSETTHGDPSTWPLFMSMSVGTGRWWFSGSEFEIEQPIVAEGGFISTIVSASNVSMSVAGDPIFFSAQHMQDTFHSAGRILGGDILSTVTAPTSVTYSVNSGSGLFRIGSGSTSQLKFVDWSTGSIAHVTSSNRYIGVAYNDGTPNIIAKATDEWNYYTEFPLHASILGITGSDLHTVTYYHGVGDHANTMIQRMHDVNPIQRDVREGGLTIGDAGSKKVSVSAGALWSKLNRFPIPALDTSAGDTFTGYYRTGSDWVASGSMTDWNNTEWDNSGSLEAIPSNRYVNNWFYYDTSAHLMMIFPQAEYSTVANALEEAPPADVPPIIQEQAILIGRIVAQEGTDVAEEVQTAFTTELGTSGVTDHGSLTGLSDDDHIQYYLTDGTRDGLFSGYIPSGSRVYHELVDDAAISSSFTMSLTDGNAKSFAPGTSLTVHFSGSNAGQVSLIEIRNSGDHTVTLTGNPSLIWHLGEPDSVPSGSSLLSLTHLVSGQLAQFVAKDIK